MSTSTQVFGEDTEGYQNSLREAKESDLSDVERSGCIKLGSDLDGDAVIFFMPRLAINDIQRLDKSQDENSIMRRVLLLFIKLVDELVHHPYSIVYCHLPISILGQHSLITQYYNTMPKRYKKHVKHIYVVRPTMSMKLFFEFTRIFVSGKFYAKLKYLSSLAALQCILPLSLLSYSMAVYRWDDEFSYLTYSPNVPIARLSDSFCPLLSAPCLVYRCVEYLRIVAMKHVGLFRVAGDQMVLMMAKARLQRHLQTVGSYCSQVLGGEKGDVRTDMNTSEQQESLITEYDNQYIHIGIPVSHIPPIGAANSRAVTTVEPTHCCSNAVLSRLHIHTHTGEVPNVSTIVIDQIDSVAQILKATLGSLPVPVITPDIYDVVVKRTRQYCDMLMVLAGTSGDEAARAEAPADAKITLERQWFEDVCGCIEALPKAHIATWKYLIKFLADVAENAEVNLMTPANLTIVFVPLLFHQSDQDPALMLVDMKYTSLILTQCIVHCMDKGVALYDITATLPTQPTGVYNSSATGSGDVKLTTKDLSLLSTEELVALSLKSGEVGQTANGSESLHSSVGSTGTGTGHVSGDSITKVGTTRLNLNVRRRGTVLPTP